MTQFCFCCYPWDLEAEGIETAVARLAGEIGVDAVSVAAVHADVAELRPRGPEAGKTVVREAAVNFQPAAPLYAGTRIKPNVPSGPKTRNLLDKIARAAQKQRLALRVGLSACRNPVIAERYPIAVCENVFGEKDRRRLCPSNPDVRAYVSALAEDLTTNYPATTLDLSDPDFGDGAGLGRFLSDAVQPSETERVLWSWCFCPSCRQRAEDLGADVEAASRTVRQQLTNMLEIRPRGNPPDFDSLLANDRDLAAYQNMRIQSVCSLVRMICSRVDARVIMEISATDSVSGSRVRDLRECCGGLAFRACPRGAGVLAEDHELVERAREAGGPENIELLYPCSPPAVMDGDVLVRSVHQAAAAKFAGLAFVNYGLAAEACLEWVRRAVRYARRER